VTEQESSSSNEQASSANDGEVARFTLVAAVGIMGTREDCERFMELMVADFNARCVRANQKIFKDRIVLLPIEETIPTDGEVQ
jgi:hypothetical protein